MIETHYILTFEEWAEGQTIWCKSVVRKTPGTKALLAVWYGMAALAGASLGPATHYFGCILLALMLAQWIIVKWRRKPVLKAAFSQATDRDRETYMTINEEGYHSTRPGFNECRMSWQCFSGWKEGKLTIVLGRASQYCCVPKRCLNAEQLDALRTILKTHLV